MVPLKGNPCNALSRIQEGVGGAQITIETALIDSHGGRFILPSEQG